jgi:uncharacterized membrane protein YfcA
MPHLLLAIVSAPPLTLPSAIALFVAALVGGALNSVAGGGSFFAFPTLIFTGVGPITANATNTIALWPGSVASVGAYRRDLGSDRALLAVLASSSVVGGVLGAIVLLKINQGTFVALIPFLLLLATVLFTISPRLTAWARRRATPSERHSPVALGAVAAAQLVIATYGGFFGGGIGIMMLATLGMMGMTNIHRMNALKTLLTAIINGVAVITFIVARAVAWPQALAMIVAAILGGYYGAFFARKIDPRYVRGFVTVVGAGLTIYFFVKPH